ncbi:putative uncharacterized hydrolase [Cardiosporidium cionae]|uniref:Uncharacterized hydrolase n=1 Tax=Cardiosporidium cionae TaxID=476202 RepID=A0ABQ7JAW4_9APIC|nr:putative uncharacterized hydrolase [Cardiosporidium cionae]|eukprot:KAF8821124.1 putative uncharacterized hydrolase [Cardiosporidium cionae]
MLTYFYLFSSHEMQAGTAKIFSRICAFSSAKLLKQHRLNGELFLCNSPFAHFSRRNYQSPTVSFAVATFNSVAKIMEMPPKFNATELKGLLFDMDGTLTISNQIDFERMRLRLDLEPGEDILETVKLRYGDCPNVYNAKMKIISEFEAECRSGMAIQPYAKKLLHFLRVQRPDIKTALISRNNRQEITYFLEKFGLTFDAIIGREDMEPVKPHPACVLDLSQRWEMSPSLMLFIGDDKYDVECGQRAGTWTCLFENSSNKTYLPMADFTVDSLYKFAQLMGLKEDLSVQ